MKKANRVINDLDELKQLLSGRRFRVLQCRLNGFNNSLNPLSIKLVNKVRLTGGLIVFYSTVIAIYLYVFTLLFFLHTDTMFRSRYILYLWLVVY